MQVSRWTELAAPRRVDLFIAAGLLIWGLPDVPWWWEPPGHAGSAVNVAVSLALTLAMSVPFCWRRSFPLPVLAAAAAVLVIRIALARDDVSASAAVLVAAYGLGACGSTTRRYARWLGWVSLTTAVFLVMTNYGENRLNAVPYALLGAAFVLGDAASARRGETAAAVEAAHQAERARIARELHDVVAHQLSAIAVQAGAARLAAGAHQPSSRAKHLASGSAKHLASGSAPQQAPADVLGAIEQLSREALTELNHLLGALRREPDADPDHRPAPALSDLGALLDASRGTGGPVELVTEGAARQLSPGVELSAYRIVQEALANAARHAPGAPVRMTLCYRTRELGIEVTNPPSPLGRRAAGALVARPGGRGIRGMRERAELYGGRLDATAGADGGFTVSGAIPYDGVPARAPGPGPAQASPAADSPASARPAPPGPASPPPNSPAAHSPSSNSPAAGRPAPPSPAANGPAARTASGANGPA
jgi:signal transduction histidine kinase